MNVTKIILEELILENRLQQVLNKFNSRRGKNLVNKVSNADPSGNNKYLHWVIKMLTDNEDNSDYLVSNNYSMKNSRYNSIMEAINYFHENIANFDKKDINQYKTQQALGLDVNEVKQKKLNKEKELRLKKDVTKIYEDENITVVMPKTHESSCYYGMDTKWCTTSKSSGAFDQYSDVGYLFYFIVKNPIKGDRKYYKIANHIGVDSELFDLIEEFDYHLEDYDFENMDDINEILEDFCYNKECITNEFFDAPDHQYSSLSSVLDRGNPYPDEVKSSIRKAHQIIEKKYQPIVKEFSSKLIKQLEKFFMEEKYGKSTGKQMENITNILKMAGVEDPSELKLGEVMEIVNDYLNDNDSIDVDDIHGYFGRQYPLGER